MMQNSLVLQQDADGTHRLRKALMEKVNQHSGVEVSSADFEQVVSTNIERDIRK